MNRHTNTQNPYATTPQQQSYPSQAVDYLSLSVGGAYTPAERNAQRSNNWQQGSVPYFYRDSRSHHYGQGGGGGGGSRGGFRGGNRGRHQSYRGKQGFNHSGDGGGGGSHQFKSYGHISPASKDDTYRLYFHPSMLEDPWQELMNRHYAIRFSAINTKKTIVDDADEDES